MDGPYTQPDPFKSWDFNMLPTQQDVDDTNTFSPLLDLGSDPGLSQSISPQLLHSQVTQYIDPLELHPHTSYSDSSLSQLHSPQSPCSLPQLSSTLPPHDKQQILRRSSIASLDPDVDQYRPRDTPNRSRKSVSSRITPRSEKHARELELNRKAATKCRNRQKQFVQNLQTKCRKEEERMHLQTSLVHSLHEQVLALRTEVLRHSYCGSLSVQRPPPPIS
ncbi:hypothetical protein PV10_00046 [Exophiala mesophila]|uniref:BZIP domain-containing protein n=1 Tax=Exophiala mesophila TaxID=212818 RepID=A0A0D2AB38_EXOME|nr:uncharacterized protein PV10_00046 [Exophiala mesophila]KIV96143.1 hypothetical protein PV10_00046 [Exophiala mesophila]